LLRKVLEKEGFKLTEAEFAIVMEIATEDIKFNKINFHRRTTSKEVKNLISSCASVFTKCI
jgi:hypothetical protein